MDVETRKRNWDHYCYAASVKGGCRSSLRGYDAMLSGERKIGEVFRLTCIARGIDPMDEINRRRNVKVQTITEMDALMQRLLEEDPELPSWATKSPEAWEPRVEEQQVSEQPDTTPGLRRAAEIIQAEIANAESLMSVEENGKPIYDPAQMDAGVCALRTVLERIQQEIKE